MKGAGLYKVLGLLALVVAVAAIGLSLRTAPTSTPTANAEAPALPGWDAQSAHPMPELPHAPSAPAQVAEQAAHPERDLRQRADRYALALARGEFLGAEGAIALARTAPLMNDAKAQSALALALSAAVVAAAGENDFAGAEALLVQADTSTTKHPAVVEASATLRARQAFAAADPARTSRLAADLAAINAVLSDPHPDTIAAAFGRLAALAALDPGHRGPERLRQGLMTAVRTSWSSAIAAEDDIAAQAWAKVALNYLTPAERSDIEATARAARERRLAPRP